MGAIFRRDMLACFRNPIGWFTVGVYCLVSGIMFTLTVMVSGQSYMGTYFGVWLYFANILLVSLLSFRFFSEEKKNRTDQLLLTAPVKISSVVLGKYLCGVCIYSAATLVNVLYAFVVSLFGQVSWNEFLMQMLGSLLIGFAMIAVALFLSSVTENQIATVAATFGLLLFMYVIDSISGLFPAVIGEILQCISLYSRYHSFAIGLLSLAPIVYYLSISGVFLFLTGRMLEKRRWA